jgi:hypothetical protein
MSDSKNAAQTLFQTIQATLSIAQSMISGDFALGFSSPFAAQGDMP